MFFNQKALRPLTRDERIETALLGTWFFLTVATLWLLKASGVTSLLVHLGARETPYVRLAGLVAVAGAVFLYSIGANRLTRVAIVRVTSIVFAIAIAAFWLALRVGGEALASKRATVWALYVLVDVYTVVMVELFWTYTADVVNESQANRLFGLIGLGGILGGVVGGLLVDMGTHSIGANNLLLVSAFGVVGCAVLGSITERVLHPPQRQRLAFDRGDVGSALDGVHEVRKSHYLLLLVGVVVAYEFAATLADYGVNVVFEQEHLTPERLESMYGRLGWIASGVGVVAQLVLVPLVLPSKRIALVVPPIALLASAVGVVIVPVLLTAFVMASIDRGLNISLQQSTRESLYVPLTDAQKYKAKAFIDMFVDRAAKAGASLVLLALIAVVDGSPRVTIGVGCMAILVWIASARRLGSYTAELPTAGATEVTADLMRPEAYATIAPTATVMRRETQLSRVFMLDHDVFKAKKPANLRFLDYTTLEARQIACEAEVALNIRLAPNVYRGVVPVRRGEKGYTLDKSDGPIVEWLVHMARLPDEDRADARLAKGDLGESDVDAIASRLAAFHTGCRSDVETAAFGMPAAVAHNVAENFAQTRHTLRRYLSARRARQVIQYQASFLRDHAALFDKRVHEGRCRDGHGDLRLEHIYLDESRVVTIIDCIELNERFRYADVCADVAFLSMDLTAHGRPDLAERFLATYARTTNDFGLYEVIDFYESYRAFVRGKISAMIACDPSLDRATRSSAADDAHRYYALAVECGRRGPRHLPPDSITTGIELSRALG